ncbi:MAG: serine/threonine-protein kinase RsbW [Solirubrobacteraceae bacterium]|nr:serine/threonine-protein kinase RsbW [Solirubrobacteraceae bacterium]
MTDDVDYSLQRFSETLPAYAVNVRTLRRAVVRFAEEHGADAFMAGSVALAVGEALNNVVLHAYRDHLVPGNMTVDAHVEMSHLAVAVRDEGSGFNPRSQSPGAGYGLPVIASLAAAMSVATNRDDGPSGTAVLMNFELADAGEPPPA